jgi:hypothetical protein
VVSATGAPARRCRTLGEIGDWLALAGEASSLREQGIVRRVAPRLRAGNTRFTEGFDTGDLVETKTLIEALATSFN